MVYDQSNLAIVIISQPRRLTMLAASVVAAITVFFEIELNVSNELEGLYKDFILGMCNMCETFHRQLTFPPPPTPPTPGVIERLLRESSFPLEPARAHAPRHLTSRSTLAYHPITEIVQVRTL